MMAPLTVGELAQLVGLLSAALLFIILIVVDTDKAVQKANYWVPGHALVLTALTIQLMNFVENRSALLNQALLNCPDAQKPDGTVVAEPQFMNFVQVQTTLLDQNSKQLIDVNSNKIVKVDDRDVLCFRKYDPEVLKDTLFMVHCSRVMLCVLIAFFLPGMARSGAEGGWTEIAALGFSLFIHIFSELLCVRQTLKDGVPYFRYVHNISMGHKVWVIVYGAIISVSLVWLLQLLICATIANKSIRAITLRRIPLILTIPEENSWQAVENQVLKSTIVARACCPESIISRSALGSSASFAVTVCVLLSIVSWIVQRPFTKILGGLGFWLKFIITIVEILFILIGGAIIWWRWFLSIVYFGQEGKINWHDYFRVEDYWIRYIVELQKTGELQQLPKRANKFFGGEGKVQKVARLFLQCVLWLQWFVVFFSKGYWFLSQHLYKIATMILSKHLEKVKTEFKEYEDVLSNVYVLSQTPLTVFLTDRKFIKQARVIMEKGNEAGEGCDALISFLKHRIPETGVDIPCLHPGTVHDQTGLKFLWKCDSDSTLDMKKYFIFSSKWSWKLTAVSLINIISRIGGDSCGRDDCSCGRDYFKAYEEAWELMDLVEELDREIDSFLSRAADRQFMTLQSAQKGEGSPVSAKTMEEADAAIKVLAEESKREAEMNDHGQDTPVDWEKLAAGFTSYKICMSMDCRSGDLTELKNKLQSTLAYIIGACIEKLGVALVESSRKWAQEMEERKLLEAVYIAGKSKGLMEKLGWDLGWDPELRIAQVTKKPGWRLNALSDPLAEE